MLPKRIYVLTLAALAAGGCAVKPTAIPTAEHNQRVADDMHRIYTAQEPLAKPLSLADAFARALTYNMDYRQRMMEEASALGQSDLSNFDMLPKLTASAGYSWRNNDAFGLGYQPNGTVSATPSAASERSHNYNSLVLSWNILDFGLSYFRAKQMADQFMIAEERRRKAQQNLLQDVRSAWWRAEAAERLLPEVDELLKEIDQAAARAKLIETRKLLPPLQIVAYRRSLLDLEQQLSLRRQDLSQARIELSQLMGLRPGTEYKLETVAPDDQEMLDLGTHINTLEAIALENRPELREEGYRERVTQAESKKTLLSILPSLNVYYGSNYDSNKYLINNRWTSAGTDLIFNLFKAFSLPSMMRANEAAENVDKVRRLAVTTSVLGQTHIAAVRYRLMQHELTVWNDAVQDDARIVGYLNASKQVGLETELELIRAKGRSMISRINRDLHHANMQAAVGRLYNSIGLDALPLEEEISQRGSLARALGDKLQAWEQQHFVARSTQRLKPVSVASVRGIGSAEHAEAFKTSLQRILTLSKIPSTPLGSSEYVVETSVAIQPPGISGNPAIMTVRLLGENGSVLFEGTQNSMLITPIGPDQWRALGEGAAYRIIDPIRQFLLQASPENGPPETSTVVSKTLPPAQEKTPDAATLRSDADLTQDKLLDALQNALLSESLPATRPAPTEAPAESATPNIE